MRDFLEVLRNITLVFSLCCVLMLNLIIQSPRILTTEEDYNSMMELASLYKAANVAIDDTKVLLSLTELCNETAKLYFYTVNNPTKKDISKLDSLRLVAPYWGRYVFSNKMLKELSASMQNMNNNPSSASMSVLSITDSVKAKMKIDLYDMCYSLRYRDKMFYLLMQLLGALAFVALLYLYTMIFQSKYKEYDDNNEYDEYEYEEEQEEFDDIEDMDSLTTIKLSEVEEQLSKNIKELTDGRKYFTQLR